MSSLRRKTLFAAILFPVIIAALLIPAPDGRMAQTVADDAEPESTDDPKKPKAVPAEFEQAGVCARCHVVSVLEWGLSGHVEEETNCRECHGPSKGHVANERNEVKPDRLPHGKAIAKQLCATCHETGCPETLEVESCQKCHHVHALIDPSKPPSAKDDRLAKLLTRWRRFRERMEEGEKRIAQENWRSARQAFREALELTPGHHLARARLEFCERRLDPTLPGFEIVGSEFDRATGLPLEIRVADLGTTMLLLPPGQFDLGSDALPDSRPVHTVGVDAFYLGQREVTQGEWKAIMGTNPSAHQGDAFPDADHLPVERVSWQDCGEFLRKLNRKVPGGGFRLPTEAEWEYAARLGTPSPGRDEIGQYARYRANSLRAPNPDDGFRQIDAYAPGRVGTRRADERGFYDLQGNVGEWCSSLFSPYLYDASDGRESMAEPGMRIVRGGSFADSATSLDPTLRHAERPHRRLRWNGFRLARSVPSLPRDDATSKER